MGALDGRHALVTGGGSGIGAAVAKLFAAEGARVTIAGRNRERLRRAAGDAMLPLAADVTSQGDIEALFAQAAKENGPADIVVAAAGAAESAPLKQTGLELFDAMLAVNLTGVFLTLKAGLAQMPKAWGRAVVIASTAGLKGYPYVSAYCAAKHGAVGLVRALAAETAAGNITVNAVCPGFTETELLERSLDTIVAKTGLAREAAAAQLLQNNPQGRFIQPAEVARAALWLCGPDSGAVTGQAVAVSGGET